MRENEPNPGREPFAAYALLASAVLGVAVMAVHPNGHQLRDAVDGIAMVGRNRIVHAVAIAAVLLQTSGALAVVRRAGRGQVGLAHLAFVLHCAGTASVVIAGLCSGFVLPQFLADGKLADLVFAMNQAFAKLYAVAGSAAIAAWSIAGWRRILPAATAGIGLVVGTLVAVLVAVGHLRLDVHGMGALVLAQSVWWVLVAIGMLRNRA